MYNLTCSVLFICLNRCFVFCSYLEAWPQGYKFILKLKIKLDNWLIVDTCLQAAYHCTFLESENESK